METQVGAPQSEFHRGHLTLALYKGVVRLSYEGTLTRLLSSQDQDPEILRSRLVLSANCGSSYVIKLTHHPESLFVILI